MEVMSIVNGVHKPTYRWGIIPILIAMSENKAWFGKKQYYNTFQTIEKPLIAGSLIILSFLWMTIDGL